MSARDAADGVHVNHRALPGYDERNVYFDGCPVCEARAASGLDVFNRLDDENLERLSRWASALEFDGVYPDWQSDCDRRVCELILRLRRLLPKIGRGGVVGL